MPAKAQAIDDLLDGDLADLWCDAHAQNLQSFLARLWDSVSPIRRRPFPLWRGRWRRCAYLTNSLPRASPSNETEAMSRARLKPGCD
jgi:hypothetical protein